MNPEKPIVRSHLDLEAWQHAMDLADRLYDVADRLPRHEMYGLASQLRRAAVSVPANIAEGHGRDHLGDYLRHLSISSGSLAEIDTLVRLGHRRGYISSEEAAELIRQANRTGQILSGLIRALKRRYRAPSTEHPAPRTVS